MLEVKNVGYTLLDQMGNQTSFKLSDVDFSLQEGYFMCVLGENGSGKSTLLELLYGSMPCESGTITYAKQDVFKHSDRIRQKVAYVSTDHFFLEDRSLDTNIKVFSSLYPMFQKELFDKYFKMFGFDSIQKSNSWNFFSAGERYLIQVAFSLAREPKVLLLDEPLANLDPVIRMQLIDLLQVIIAKEFLSVVMTTHIFSEVEQIADYILFMKQGKMLFFGEKEELLLQQGKQDLAELFD